MLSPSRTSYYIAKITGDDPSVFPSTGSAFAMPYVGSTMPTYERAAIVDDTRSADRQSGGTVWGLGSGAGGWAFNYREDSKALEILRESAFGNVHAADGSLKAGANDIYIAFAKKMPTGDNTARYYEFTTTLVTKFALTITPGEKVTGSVDLLIGRRSDAAETTAPAGVTLVDPTYRMPLTAEGATIEIEGLEDHEYASCEFLIEHTRAPHNVIGSNYAKRMGTEGNRNATTTVTYYENDFTFIDDSPRKVTITFANGEKYTMNAATASYPKQTEDGSRDLVEIVLTAGRHPDGDVVYTPAA